MDVENDIYQLKHRKIHTKTVINIIKTRSQEFRDIEQKYNKLKVKYAKQSNVIKELTNKQSKTEGELKQSSSEDENFEAKYKKALREIETLKAVQQDKINSLTRKFDQEKQYLSDKLAEYTERELINYTIRQTQTDVDLEERGGTESEQNNNQLPMKQPMSQKQQLCSKIPIQSVQNLSMNPEENK